MALLEVSHVSLRFGGLSALVDVGFHVERGEVFSIIGPNGAGKTTILKTISGVMDPEKGSIEFLGKRIDRSAPDKIVRLGISQVPEGREVFEDLTVRENLMKGAFVRSDRSAIREDLEAVYDLFPILKKRESQFAGNMSGGEQQMPAIGRAMMARPKLMLLDEPSLGLSPLLVKEIFRIIGRINREQNTSILVVEQNALMALSLAHRGYVLELGRIVLEDSCKALMDNEDVKEFYLGVAEENVRGAKRWKRKKKWR